MRNTRTSTRRGIAIVLLAAVGLPLAGTAQARPSSATAVPQAALPRASALRALGPVTSTACTASGTGTTTCSLYAKSATMALPGLASVNIWGYTTGAADALTAPGGPILIVDAGQAVTVTLTNTLGEATSLLLQGQALVPDRAGAAGGGGTTSYTFTASKPGTYLYEAGLVANAEHQNAMGLHGALIVRPAIANQAYDTGTYAALSAFSDEGVLVLSEIDPALNNSASPAGFDMRKYAPKYALINGALSPNTAPITSAAGNKVLVRYVNAGIQPHSMAVLGLHQTLVANDGYPYQYPRVVVADTVSPGQTADAVVAIPAGAASGSSYAVYDGSLSFNNNASTGIGGMLTFISLGAPTGNAPPAVSAFTATPTGFTATITASGVATMAAAEYYLDAAAGAPGSGIAITGLSGTSAAVTAAFATAVTAAGTHLVQLRGQDSTGAWGPLGTATFTIAATDLPPTTSGLTLTPNPATTVTPVAIAASASDVATGGQAITAAEYTLDGGAAVAMTVTSTGTSTANVSATIPAGLAVGSHSITVRSRDATGNWSAAVTGSLTVTLPVDTTGPVTSVAVASPNPTNGLIGVNSGTAAVRISATATDAISNVAGGEAFIDVATPVNGTGIVLSPVDGTFNSMTEGVYTDIPLATIAALSNGNHTITVHGKDAPGNWGGSVTITLIVDKTAPTITSTTLTPATIAIGTASVTLGVVAADVGLAGLAGGQYWIDGTTTPPASATAFTGTSAPVTTSALAAGAHSVRVRMKDAAGNWSAVSSATLNVVLAVNDARSITANTSATQTSDTNAASNLLVNDQPTGVAGRTTRIGTAPVRTGGTGTGTITVSCPGSLGTAAAPAVSGNTVCTNGAYRVTLNGVGTTNATRQASKRGTYQFTYTEIMNGAVSTATVTITVV